MRFSDLFIKTRLQTGFFIILGLIALISSISFWYSSRLWDYTRQLYEHPYKVNMTVRDIERNVLEMETHMKEIVMGATAEEVKRDFEKINLNEAEADRLIDTIYMWYLGRKTSVDSLRLALHEWKSLNDTTIMLFIDGRVDEARFRMITKGTQSTEKLLSKVEILKAFAMDRGQKFFLSASNAREMLFIWMIIILTIMMIILVIIFRFLYNSVAVPLTHITGVLEKFSTGDHTVRSNYLPVNEFGFLARAFNSMADSVRQELETKAEIAAISDAMLAHDDLPLFCRSVLDALMRATNSSVGAVYVLQETERRYMPVYAIGFDEKHIKPLSGSAQEGELGLAIQSGSLNRIMLKPEDTVFGFKSVLGTLIPKEIITIPVFRQSKVVAFFTVGSIEGYSTKSMEVLKLSEQNLNMSTNAILAFENIKQNVLKLDRQNELLNEQSKELKMQTSELQEQNTELERQKIIVDEANRLKSAFLSSMSHELRTPLNAVIALTGVLTRRLKDKVPDEEFGFLEVIERNGRELLDLINDILDLSRIESGKTGLNLSELSVFELVEEIVETIKPLADEKKISLVNQVPKQLPPILSDHDKCHHILQNILSNAVKFTHTGGVRVFAAVDRNQLTISVNDTGIGIPSDQIECIFDEFRQVDMGTSRKYSGTGLGLAIADKYARLIGGTIQVESTPGVGSTFKLIIPLSVAGDSAEIYSKDVPVKGGNQKHQVSIAPGKLSGRRILVVEDSEPVIIQLREILNEEGCLCDIARNGIEAIEMVGQQIPDAIILDIMMPELDGFGVLEEIRSKESTAALPVLVLTAKYLEKDDLKRLARNNIFQYLRKGDVDSNELLNHIRSMFPDQKIHSLKGSDPTGTIKLKPAIAVIDDNADSVLTISALLGEQANVTGYSDMAGFISSPLSAKPDLLLLDIMLPGTDGVEGLRIIRGHPGFEQIPIVAFTAHAMKGDRERILQMGFDDYLSKPFNPDDLMEIFNKWINL